MKLVVVLVLTLASSAGINLVVAQPALASCPGEETLFVRGLTNGGAIIQTARGTGTTTPVRWRDLAPCQPNSAYNPEAHSTAHLTNAGYTKFIEVGWVEYFADYPGPFFSYFLEGNDGTGGGFTWGGFQTGGDLTRPQGGPGSSYLARFWLQHFGSQTQFHLYVDWNNDSVIDDIWGSPNMLFTAGVPRGETGRRGGTGTGASDRHIDLQYFNQNNTWVNWGNNGSPQDNISNWHWVRVTDTEYKVVSG